jgi:DNA-binding PadR family transcriptional regulator
MHAYRMQQLIRHRGKDRVVNVRRRASLHQTLERLVRLGYVEIQGRTRTEGRPERIVYAITDQGREAAKNWLRELLTNVGGEFPSFPAALSMLPVLSPAEARRHIEARADKIRRHIEELRAIEQAARGLPALFLLEEAYNSALLEAELKWLKALIVELDDGRVTWDDKWLREAGEKFDPEDETRLS